MTLLQAKTGKYFYYSAALVLAYFHLTKARITPLLRKTTVASFLHLMVLICNVFISYFTKGQFKVLLVTMLLIFL